MAGSEPKRSLNLVFLSMKCRELELMRCKQTGWRIRGNRRHRTKRDTGDADEGVNKSDNPSDTEGDTGGHATAKANTANRQRGAPKSSGEQQSEKCSAGIPYRTLIWKGNERRRG